ncbi:odorant receptor 131-2-like [Rhinophrynus dorsalis]
MTQVSISSNAATEIVKMVLLVAALLGFCIYLYFMAVILNIFFTTPHVRENARYVLFVHMLINDALHLLISLFLLLAFLYLIRIPAPVCYVTVILATSTFRITPYNLAAMALERYVAICFPLRHVEICTIQKTNVSIALMWVLGLIPNVADFIAMSSSVKNNFFTFNLLCNRIAVTLSPLQDVIMVNVLIVSLILVGLIIFYTYIRVMLVARKIGSGKSSALKAGKTVMLHAFQLLLCMTSSMSAFTQKYPFNYLIYFPLSTFLLFTCLPRFLSPLIYGLRDEVFYKHIRKSYCRDFTEYR